MMNGNNKLFRSRNVIRFLLCFFLPAAMLLYERIRLGAIGNLTADAELYLSVADNFLNTGHFIQCIRWFPGFVVPPGMPLILLILRLLKFSVPMIIGFQACMFGMSCLLLEETEHRLFQRYGIAPVIYLLGYMRCRLLLGNILVEHYYLFLLCLLIWLVLGSNLRRKLLWMNITGLLLLMTRPALSPVYVIILSYTAVVCVREKRIASLAGAFLLPIVCLSVNLTVNYRETGEFILLESYSGADLYITASPNAPVTVKEGLRFYDETREKIYYAPDMTMSEKSKALNELSKQYIREHPGEYLKKAALRCVELFLKSYSYTTLFALAGAVLMIWTRKNFKERQRHMILLGINFFLALETSFGIPEVRYTAVILPLAVIHGSAFLLMMTDILMMKSGEKNGQSCGTDSVL